MTTKQQVINVQLLINNEQVSGHENVNVFDPGRLDDLVATVSQGSPEQANQAIEAAYAAYQSWKQTTVEERCALLQKSADAIEAKLHEYADILLKEVGIIKEQSIGEMFGAIGALRVVAEIAPEFLKPQIVEDEKNYIKIEKTSLGVVAAILPWNVPMAIALNKIAPILATGNTVVVKPSPNAAVAVSLALTEMAKLFPPGVINVIHGDVSVGEAITSHPLVRKITLTGGERTAKQIMKSSANTLKRLHFELGGNDPAVILDDATLETAIPQIVQMAFMRSGQICVATKRVYVPKHLYEQATKLFIEQMNQFTVGHGSNPNVNFGPVNNKLQYDKVKQLIEDAKQQATVYELGKKAEDVSWDNGNYILPTLVTNIDAHHPIVLEEQFGPVLPLVAYESEEQVLAEVNGTEFGLGSSVWTSNQQRGFDFAEKIEAGMTGINGSIDSPVGFNIVPFGGVKQSGFGWERGTAGLSEFISYHSLTYHK